MTLLFRLLPSLIWMFPGNRAYSDDFLTPLLTRNNILCSAEIVQSQERYFCDQDFNIQCVPGWKDESMLCAFPICPEDCNAIKKQGMCLRPGLCACSPGWKGISCNECVPRQGCARGSCQKPGECACYHGFYGPLCNKVLLDDSFKLIDFKIPQIQKMEKRINSWTMENKEEEDTSNSIQSNNSISTTDFEISELYVKNDNVNNARNLSKNELSSSESHSLIKSSSEDFTAPRRKHGKTILNSTEYFQNETPPSTLRFTDEETTTINELERNIENSSETEQDSLLSKRMIDFAPRFGEIFDVNNQDSHDESTESSDNEKNEEKKSAEKKKTSGTPKTEGKHRHSIKKSKTLSKHVLPLHESSKDSNNPLNRRSNQSNSQSNHMPKIISTSKKGHYSKNDSNHKSIVSITEEDERAENARGNKSRHRLKNSTNVVSKEAQDLTNRSVSSSSSTEVDVHIHDATKKSQSNSLNSKTQDQEMISPPIPEPSTKSDSASSTTAYTNPNNTVPKSISSKSSNDDVAKESDSIKKLDRTIENISSLKKDIHSIEQQLNISYITQLLNASSSLRDLGFKHCRNRITDVGHPYHSDAPMFGSKSPENISCDGSYPYYSLDGSCNSVSFPTRGMAFTPFRRVVDPIDLVESDFNQAMDFEEDHVLCRKRLQIFKKQNIRYAPLVRAFASFVALDMAQCLGVIQNPGGNKVSNDGTANGECPPHFEEETVNRITAFIDGSQIYGNTFHESIKLRVMSGGQLKISKDEVFNFLAQLKREQSMSVDLLVVLFKLEHNRLARQIKDTYNAFNLILGGKEDETIYQESRRIVLGVLQHIIYDEFLPAVLGSNVYYRFELTSKKNTYYDKNINPSIFSGFVTSFSHLFTDPCKTATIEGVSKTLFEKDKPGIMFEDHPHLIAIFSHLNNDHGYYKDYQRLCSTKNGSMDEESWKELVDVFKGNASSIDLLSGALMEDHVHGGLVGPTFACIIAYQFHLVKAGDRRFYSHVRQGTPSHLNTKTDATLIQSLQHPKPKVKRSFFKRMPEPKYYTDALHIDSIRDSSRFNYDEIDEIRTRTMSGLLCDNGNIFETPMSPFFTVDRKWNTWIRCDSLIPFNARTFIDSSNAPLLRK